VGLNIILARQAIRLPEFQNFLIEEMKLKKEDVEKLGKCGACWNKLNFQPRSLEKINNYLEFLEAEKKIRKSFFKKKELVRMVFLNKKEAIEFIESSKDVEKIQIILRKL